MQVSYSANVLVFDHRLPISYSVNENSTVDVEDVESKNGVAAEESEDEMEPRGLVTNVNSMDADNKVKQKYV